MLSKKTYVGGKYGKIVVFWVVMGYQPCVRQRDALSLKPTTPCGHGSGMRQTSALELTNKQKNDPHKQTKRPNKTNKTKRSTKKAYYILKNRPHAASWAL